MEIPKGHSSAHCLNRARFNVCLWIRLWSVGACNVMGL